MANVDCIFAFVHALQRDSWGAKMRHDRMGKEMSELSKEPEENAMLELDIGQDLRPQKLSHAVAGRLRDQIATGKLKAGTQLPPENQLLTIFNVSRPTLREALRILEAESLISVGRGMRSGATVLGPSIKKAAQYANFLLASEGATMRELHMARDFFEPAIIRSLSGKSLKSATKSLRRSVDELEKSLASGDYSKVIAGTKGFHEELAEAAGNKVVKLLLGMLRSISDDVYVEILDGGDRSQPGRMEKGLANAVAAYGILCNHLEKGDTDEAADFWSGYMDRSLSILNKTGLGGRKLVQDSTN